MSKNDLEVWHAEEITAADGTVVQVTKARAKANIGTRTPDFINVSTAGEYRLTMPSGEVCDNLYLNAGWNAQPFTTFEQTGSVATAARAGWRQAK